MSIVYNFFIGTSLTLITTSSWCTDLDKNKKSPEHKMNKTFSASSEAAKPATTTPQTTKHSRIDVQIQNNSKIIEFKVIPNDGLVINTEGPWSLILDEKNPLKFKNAHLKVADFDAKIPGFRAELASDLKNIDKTKTNNAYKMVVFVCTADKKVCYRDVHENTF